MVSQVMIARLRSEMAKPDPWRLSTNPFEQRRYAAMEEMLEHASKLPDGLEIGCATGTFTERLARRCRSLRVVDLLPEALARCVDRVGDASHVTYTLADISETIGWNETYDVIVVSEVLYYLGNRAAVRRAVSALQALVREGGVVIFGSATDHTVRRWGHQCGAETAILEFGKSFNLHEQMLCLGSTPNECALLARFSRPEAGVSHGHFR